MKTKQTLLISLTALLFTSCDLVEPGNTINPNVDEEKFLNTPKAMQTWVNGAKATFATNLSEFIVRDEMISDNYFNAYTRISNTFDIPSLPYTDDEVEQMQRCVGAIREAAAYGINTVAKHDATTTSADLFTLYTMHAYADIMAGESFTALPAESKGFVKPWQDHLVLALEMLEKAETLSDSNEDRAFVETLMARAYYKMGIKDKAVAAAREALRLSPTLLRQVTFDGDNNVNNTLQSFIWGAMLQPLPRLDFLDPKYFKTSSTEERPINIAKAEEDYLILAEAAVADGNLSEARTELTQLLALVKERPVKTGLMDDDDRNQGKTNAYPTGAGISVRASADDPYRGGLVLDRSVAIAVPYISGTSVTADMINNATSVDALLETIYLMRQEIFFAEGRRTADLGIRIPLCDVEFAALKENDATGPKSGYKEYTEAVIPSYIPLDKGMDAFTWDKEAKMVTINYNMNRILVENHATAFAK